MDITRPPLDRQVAPAPWLVFRQYVDVPTAIREILAEKPDATVEDVSSMLAGRGVQVSGMIIAMWLSRLRAEQKKSQEATVPPNATAQE